jgi:hypothetical protein
MTNLALTLSRLFEEDAEELRRRFEECTRKELTGTIWIAALPSVVKKFDESLDLDLSNVLVAAWRKVKEILAVLSESKEVPGKVFNVDLVEHTITAEQHPYIEVRIERYARAKRIKFTVILSLTLKAFSLQIKEGEIREIKTGSCNFAGTLKFGKITLAKPKSKPIKLPGSIRFGEQSTKKV